MSRYAKVKLRTRVSARVCLYLLDKLTGSEALEVEDKLVDPETSGGMERGPLDTEERPDRPSDVVREMALLLVAALIAASVWLGFGKLMVERGFARDAAAPVFVLLLGVISILALLFFMFAYTTVAYNRGWSPICEPDQDHAFLVWDRWTRASRYQTDREVYLNPSRHIFLLRPFLKVDCHPAKGVRINAELERMFIRSGTVCRGTLYPMYELDDTDGSRVAVGLHISYQGTDYDTGIAPRRIDLWSEIRCIFSATEQDTDQEDANLDATALRLTSLLLESLRHAVTRRPDDRPSVRSMDGVPLQVQTNRTTDYRTVCSRLMIEVVELKVYIPETSPSVDHPRVLRNLMRRSAFPCPITRSGDSTV